MNKNYGFHLNVSGALSTIDQAEEKINKALRPAAYEGSLVMYNAVQGMLKQLGVHEYTGALADAIYQVWSKRKSGENRQVYEVSYNKQKAPHGHLVEYGFVRQYKVIVDKQGRYRTAVKPEMMEAYKKWTNNGTKTLPRSLAHQFFVPREGGPVHVPARPFMRASIDRLQDAAAAMHRKIVDEMSNEH